MVVYFLARFVTAAGDQRTAGSSNKVEVIYSRDNGDGVTASFTKDSTEVKPGQKRSGPLLMFLNKGEFSTHFQISYRTK